MFSSDALFIQDILLEFRISIELSLPNQVRHLVNDTRALATGDIFCAVNGTQQKGRVYIEQALESNCHVILVECENADQHGDCTYQFNKMEQSVAIIAFYQLNAHLFSLAKAFYQSPQNKMRIIGITGTNGKTSTSQIIAKLFEQCQKDSVVIGTNGAGSVDNLLTINNTTPGATQLHQLLQAFADQKQSYVAMEVSSHALAQGRVTADLFNTAVFTNLTRDHLDFHQTMENYADAKFQLFTGNEHQMAVINGDDLQAQHWLNNWPCQQPVIVYGRSNVIAQYTAYVQATNIEHLSNGTTFHLNTHLGNVEVVSQLIGDFNIDNLLAAIAVLIIENIGLTQIAASIASLTPITGRMESFSKQDMPLTIVDYAHTPDALKNALHAARQHCDGSLWVVFGCGGDRDNGKRRLMGEIAERQSDHIIITNDNPRTEDENRIAKDILSGCEQPDKITVLLERQKAVLLALQRAKKEDVVLLAGKGHEDYIVMGEKQIPYNERELVRSIYARGAIS